MLFVASNPGMRAAMKMADASQSKFKVGAAITRGNKVLVAASNENKTHPVFGSGNWSTLHAESNAIRKAVSAGIDLRGSTIYIYRQHNTLSKPCKGCAALIEKYGITDVVWSDSNYNKA